MENGETSPPTKSITLYGIQKRARIWSPRYTTDLGAVGHGGLKLRRPAVQQFSTSCSTSFLSGNISEVNRMSPILMPSHTAGFTAHLAFMKRAGLLSWVPGPLGPPRAPKAQEQNATRPVKFDRTAVAPTYWEKDPVQEASSQNKALQRVDEQLFCSFIRKPNATMP